MVSVEKSSGHNGSEWPTEQWKAKMTVNSDWQPIPFRQFILKVHSRCNLSCDYCYVYEMADQSWRDQPMIMREETLARTAERIAEHASSNEMREVEVIFHGGEPLLAGRKFLADAATTLRDTIGPDTHVELGIQTNGSLLDEDMLDVLLEHRIKVGVSLDGGRAAHDRHRRYANGRGSHEDVVGGLRSLRQDRYRELFLGLLCTIDLDNDPIETYEALLEFDPPGVDFLLPIGNWDSRPPGSLLSAASTPYADWLIAVFDRWYSAPRKQTRVDLFEEIINMVLGGQSRTESIGLSPVSLIVVETDGTLEQVDTLKSAFEGAPMTGMSVFAHPFDAALEHPTIAARQLGAASLCETCSSCPVVQVCGGGYYPHRYRTGSGFLNPSVYCADLFQLITHVSRRVSADVKKLVESTP